MIVVVCGFPRSGTTLFYNMLRTTVQDYTFYDREMGIEYRHENHTLMIDTSGGDQCTKRPYDVFNIDKVEKNPHMRGIVLIRDPRDVLTSEHDQVKGQFFVDWDYIWHVPEDGKPKKTNPGLVPMYDHGIKNVKTSEIIKYEALVANPNVIQDVIGDCFGFKMKGKFSDFYKEKPPELLEYQLNGLRPVDQNGIGRWKNYPVRIIQQIDECPELLDMLIELGYEADKQWFQKFKQDYQNSLAGLDK